MQGPRNAHGRFETRAVHAGQEPDPQNGAVMTPVYMTSTYVQDAPAQPRQGYEYTRTTNPTRTALEENLAALEGGRWGLCFSSGMAAVNALATRLSPGDEVVAGNDLYGGTYRIFTKVFERFGVRFHFVDTTDRAKIEEAVNSKTKYVYIESPSNPLLRLTDIAAAARIAHAAGALCVVDNTFATPYLQNPLELGADVVLHSLTKYLGGHSDVVGGCLVGEDEALREDLAFYQNSVGGPCCHGCRGEQEQGRQGHQHFASGHSFLLGTSAWSGDRVGGACLKTVSERRVFCGDLFSPWALLRKRAVLRHS